MTVGHSTHTLDEFIRILQAHGITCAVDVRTIPCSRHNPQMCAEAVPWRCHRSLIADALLVRGIHVEDIMSATKRQVHSLTPFAKVRGTAITYPAGAKSTQPTAKRILKLEPIRSRL
jgi:uncharacterized protein (DUF488 family)